MGFGLALIAGTRAESQVHSVYVYVTNDQERNVSNAIKARIGGGSRYNLTNDINKAELVLDVICLQPKSTKGFVCSYKLELYSSQTTPIGSPLGKASLTAGPDATSVAEYLFEDFVDDTSEDKLKAVVQTTREDVSVFCQSPENRNYCRQTAAVQQK